MSPPPARNRRADARRSRAVILDAAVRLLNAQPEASVEAVATAAGVTRQTVYAHFPSREHLLAATVDRITEEVVAAMDAADLDAGPAADALLRLIEVGTRAVGRYPVLLQRINALQAPPDVDHERHGPVAERIKRVVERGQAGGEFDDRLSADWLVAVVIKVGHTASEEADAGRMSAAEAAEAARVSLLRLLGVPTRPAATTRDATGHPGAARY